MGFNAADFDDFLDYDFGEKWGGKGHVPDPTTAEVRQFRDDLQAVFDAAKAEATDADADPIADTITAQDLVDSVRDLGFDKRDKTNDAILDVVIKFCNGTPSRDTLTNEKLPGFIRAGFVSWLVDTLSPLF